jgi:DinB superfamily
MTTAITTSRDPQLNQAASAFLAMFENLSADALEARPDANSWNRRQVVEHILLTYSSTTREMERRLAKGSPTSRARTMKERMVQFMLIGCGYFPRGRKAPDAVDPVQHSQAQRDGAALAQDFRQRFAEMEAAISKAEAAWGSKVAVAAHFRLGPLTAVQWRRFHAVHARHHTKQIERIAQH